MLVFRLLAGVLLLLGLQACGSEETHTHTHHEDSADLPRLHMHGEEDANAFMNRRSFDELVAAFEDKERADWQKPELVIAKMGDLSNKTVADIGAGSGYFSFRLATKAAKVIAIDVDERFMDYMLEKKQQAGIDNVEMRTVSPNDPGIESSEVDAVLMVNTYHHIAKRKTYFSILQQKLKPGGSLWIVDFKQGKLPVGPPDGHKLPPLQIEKELAEAGYTSIQTDTTSLPYQVIIQAR